MSTDTTTIRVSVRTRDILAAQARDRGVSLTVLLNDFAQTIERDAIFRSEREASRADAANAAVREDDEAWDAVTGDSID